MRLLWWVLLSGCIENGLTGRVEPAVGPPAASASVDVVELGIVCGETTASFTLYNLGGEVLNVEAIEVDGAWSLASDVSSVEPGDSVDIVLVGTGGPGTVVVHTDDPEQSEITVTLLAEVNEPPTLTLGPTPPIVAPGDQQVLTAQVDDDQGPAALALSWTSDLDGMFSTDGADTSGDVRADWDGSLRSPGTHQVTVTAVDACGASASETFTLCQDLSDTDTTLDLTTWSFTGKANWDATNDWLELTDTSRYVAGTAFETSATVDSDNVSIGFLFYASGGSSSGADGLSLTAIDTTRMTTYQGSNGGAIGYGGLPGWSIEVDTWDNTGDPGMTEPVRGDHVSFVLDGASRVSGVVNAAIHEVEDGQWHEMQVDVSGQHVTVSIDGIVYLDDDVPSLTRFPAHVGFTAATGNITNSHLIDAITVERFVCDR